MRKWIVVFVIAAVGLASADNTKLSPDLLTKSSGTVRVVVQYNQAPSLLDLKTLTGLLGSIVSALPVVNAVVADIPLTNALLLSNQSDVRYISLDRAQAPTLSNAHSNRQTRFQSYDEFRQKAREIGVEPNLQPIYSVYSRFRFSWFDILSGLLFLLFPVTGALLLIARIRRMRPTQMFLRVSRADLSG